MKNFIYILITTFLFSFSVMAGEFGPPTIWSTPNGYLGNVPLGITQEKAFDALGAPDAQQNLMGKEMWTYEVGEGYGLKKFTFIFKDGKLEDVKYTDQGPYSGLTASEVQSKDKK
jgi:hypothetical protein